MKLLISSSLPEMFKVKLEDPGWQISHQSYEDKGTARCLYNVYAKYLQTLTDHCVYYRLFPENGFLNYLCTVGKKDGVH